MMQLDHVSAGYRGVPVLRDISLQLPQGSLTVLIGPNGSGKSTLLKTAAGLIRPMQGRVLLHDRPSTDCSPREYAKMVAYLPQERSIPELSVRELVSHGRYPYLSFSRVLSPADQAAVEDALDAMKLQELADRPLARLSGGQRQRAYVAMLLAQEAELLFLDEPAAHLDIGYQLEMLTLMEELRERGKTILVVMHDLTQAMMLDAHFCLLEEGRVTALGSAGELLDSGAIEHAFGVQTIRLWDENHRIKLGFSQKK